MVVSKKIIIFYLRYEKGSNFKMGEYKYVDKRKNNSAKITNKNIEKTDRVLRELKSNYLRIDRKDKTKRLKCLFLTYFANIYIKIISSDVIKYRF